MSTRVDLRSMIHNQIVQQILNPALNTREPFHPKFPGVIGNERSENQIFVRTPSPHQHVLRSLREYKMLTHALCVALLIMTLATMGLWLWALELYGQLTFLKG